jgi:hypothetical protein
MVLTSAALVYLALSVVVGRLGRKRSIGFAGFFALSLLLTPILIGIVLLVTSPKDSAVREDGAGRL